MKYGAMFQRGGLATFSDIAMPPSLACWFQLSQKYPDCPVRQTAFRTRFLPMGPRCKVNKPPAIHRPNGPGGRKSRRLFAFRREGSFARPNKLQLLEVHSWLLAPGMRRREVR